MKQFSLAETNLIDGSTRATHTLTLSSSTITGTTGDAYIPLPTITAKYNTSADGRTYIGDSFQLECYVNGVKLTGAPFYYTGSTYNSPYLRLNANVATTLNRSTSTGWYKSLSLIFNSSNPTVSSVPISWKLVPWDAYGAPLATFYYSETYRMVGYRSASSGLATVTDGTITLNAPPTFDTTQVYFDTSYVFAGYTKAKVDISNLSAKYGGNISSVVLTIGSQTVSSTTNGTLEIDLANGGIFTPTVKVTDSRGQVTTQTLSPITVNVYTAPAVSFSAERTDSVGVINDEGESALVTAKFSWTDGPATLSAPTVVCKDSDDITVSATPTWYTDRALTTSITDWSQVAEDTDIYCLLVGYRLTSDSTVISSKEYFTRSGSGTEQDPYVYTKVTNPTGNPSTQGWYEGIFDTQYYYQIVITPVDSKTTGTTITQTLGSAFYTVDFLAGGHGIAFGQSSSQDGFFCNMDAHFVDANNMMRALFDFMYPIGSYYETSDTTFDPNVTWGGTWILETEGIVHVSAGSNYAITHASDNDGAGTKDGGETTVTLTSDQSAMPSHHHGMNNHTHSLNNHAHSVGRALGVSAGSWAGDSASTLSGSGHKYAYVADSTSNAIQTITATGGNNGNTGGNSGNTTDASVATATQAHENMPPYINVNRWHRTA